MAEPDHFYVRVTENKTKDSFKIAGKYHKILKDLLATLEIESDE